MAGPYEHAERRVAVGDVVRKADLTRRRSRTPPTRRATMAVHEDCRHYSSRSLADGDRQQRCKLGANEETPFACPVGCVFFEPRSVSDTGWQSDQ
jgi:hypothetical protein